MELKHAIEQRVSIRSFTDETIAVEDLKEIARLGSLAPSVNNYQPWNFVAVTNKTILSKMATKVSEALQKVPEKPSHTKAGANAMSQVEWFSTFFENAPSLIAVTMEAYESVMEKGSSVSHEEINRMRNYPDIQSAGACIENMLLAAVDMGYGACWMSAPMIAKSELSQILNIDSNENLIAFVAIGKPAKQLSPKPKKPIDELFRLID